MRSHPASLASGNDVPDRGKQSPRAPDNIGPPTRPPRRSSAAVGAIAFGLTMIVIGLAAVSWIELYIQARDPYWNAIPWTPLAWTFVSAGVVIALVPELHARWPTMVTSGEIASRPESKNRVGLVIWTSVLVLAVLQVINRTWVGYYADASWKPHPSWTEWHRDPLAIGAITLSYVGVWWEAGRIGHTGIRQILRVFLFPILPLLVGLAALLALMMSAGLAGGF